MRIVLAFTMMVLTTQLWAESHLTVSDEINGPTSSFSEDDWDAFDLDMIDAYATYQGLDVQPRPYSVSPDGRTATGFNPFTWDAESSFHLTNSIYGMVSGFYLYGLANFGNSAIDDISSIFLYQFIGLGAGLGTSVLVAQHTEITPERYHFAEIVNNLASGSLLFLYFTSEAWNRPDFDLRPDFAFFLASLWGPRILTYGLTHDESPGFDQTSAGVFAYAGALTLSIMTLFAFDPDWYNTQRSFGNSLIIGLPALAFIANFLLWEHYPTSAIQNYVSMAGGVTGLGLALLIDDASEGQVQKGLGQYTPLYYLGAYALGSLAFYVLLPEGAGYRPLDAPLEDELGVSFSPFLEEGRPGMALKLSY
jgi:hypothetical protein